MEVVWDLLLNILVLLAAAMVLGGLCERLHQSAIIGYLLAGTLLGPKALDLTRNDEAVSAIAQLGVALLLFSIGLEFNWRRLRALGPKILLGGGLQLMLTGVVTSIIGMAVGLGTSASVTIGAMIGLSSTACVMRTLTDRAQLDSVHGRHSIGILLVQDLAVVPLVFLVAAMGGRSTSSGYVVLQFIQEVLLAILFVAISVGAVRYVLPLVLKVPTFSRNRELPILFAMVTALGSAWLAHRLELSPALGAFIAGMVLGESPVATQIRADVAALRTLFVTLFFASIGMLADLGWIYEHLGLVVLVVIGLVACKAIIVWLVGLMLKLAHRHAIATGICLAQVGEFSFVLAEVARPRPDGLGVINHDTFMLMVSVSIVTLLLTPYLIIAGPKIGVALERGLRRLGIGRLARDPDSGHQAASLQGHVIVVGYGPAGRAVTEALREDGVVVAIIDLNLRSVFDARALGMPAYVGDATLPEILTLAAAHQADQVVMALPDHRTCVQAIRQVRAMNQSATIVARARYHAYVEDLELAGAHAVVDEEASVGERLGVEVRKRL